MPKSWWVKCPGCADEIEVDAATGMILRHRKPGAPPSGSTDLLSMARDVERRRQEAGTDFGSALQDLERRKQKAESLFDEARRKAQEELDKHGGVPPKEEDGW